MVLDTIILNAEKAGMPYGEAPGTSTRSWEVPHPAVHLPVCHRVGTQPTRNDINPELAALTPTAARPVVHEAVSPLLRERGEVVPADGGPNSEDEHSRKFNVFWWLCLDLS